MKTTKLHISTILLAILGLVSACGDYRQYVDTELASLGLSLPVGAKIRVIQGADKNNLDRIYIHTTMSGIEFDQYWKSSVFKNSSRQLSSNPFLSLRENVEGWSPKTATKGIGGMLKLNENRAVIYFFDVSATDQVEGWLLIAK